MNISNSKIINGVLYKQCTICKEWFPSTLEYFYKKKNSLSTYCKICEKKKNRKRIDNHYDDKKKYWMKYNNQPKRKAHMQEYSKVYRKNDKYKNWQKTENGKLSMKKSNKKYSNKKHNIKEKEWRACKDYFKNDNDEWVCAYCGMTEKEHKKIYHQQLHKEHVDCNGEDNLSNCVPACKRCNTSKHEFDMEEWYKQQLFFKQKRLDRIRKWLNEDYKLYIANK